MIMTAKNINVTKAGKSLLMPYNTNPKNSIYYNASLILQEINNSNEPSLYFWDLYQKMKEQYNMTLKVFIFCLDWLYQIDHPKLSRIK